MSQFILDEQVNVSDALVPLQKWAKVQRLTALRAQQKILDDRVPAILRTVKQPTFLTIDRDFWNRRLCNPDYAILCFAVADDQQELIPGYLRSLLRHPEFRTRAAR